MSNTLVYNDFVNPTDNKKYVIQVQSPSGSIYLSEEVTIPTSGVYKLVLKKSKNLSRERSNSLSGNNHGLPANQGYRSRSPALPGHNLRLPENPPNPYGNSQSGKNGIGGGNRKRKTRRTRK